MAIPDNYSQWERHERKQEKWLAERPVCYYCDNPIQDGHYYDINDEVICPDCMESHFRKEVDDFYE